MIELVAKYLSGNASEEEKIQVEEWRNENSEEFLAFSEAWTAAGSQAFDTAGAREKVMGRIASQKRFSSSVDQSIETHTTRRFGIRWWGIAASIVALLGLGYFLFDGGKLTLDRVANADGMVLVETGADETRDITLPDGSKVAMSENSSLIYPEVFGEERKVSFSGRGFFDIVADAEHPFFVETVEALVTVVGTSFQVKTEAEAKYSEVIVETGIVSLTKKPEVNKASTAVEIELSPGEVGVVRREGGGVAKSKNLDQNYLAWKTNQMVFNKTAINEVAATLHDVYKVDVTYSSEIANCRLTATFNKKPIGEVMEVISQTFGFEVIKSKGSYEIRGKGCR